MKKPNLVDEWKTVARRAWSVRLAAVAGLMGGIEGILPLFTDAIPRGIFAMLTVLASIGAMVARLVSQENMSNGND